MLAGILAAVAVIVLTNGRDESLVPALIIGLVVWGAVSAFRVHEERDSVIVTERYERTVKAPGSGDLRIDADGVKWTPSKRGRNDE